MPAIAIKRWIKRIVLVLVVISITILAIRIYDTQRGPKLELWHTFVPHEMRAAEIDKASWADYIKLKIIFSMKSELMLRRNWNQVLRFL